MKKMSSIFLSSLFFLLLNTNPLFAAEEFFSKISPFLWSSSIETKIRLDEQYLKGSFLNLQNDLNMNDSSTIFGIHSEWHFNDVDRFIADIYLYNEEVNTTLAQQIFFNGKIYNANEEIRAEVDLYNMNVFYQGLFFSDYSLGISNDFGFVTGLNLSLYKTTLESIKTGQTSRTLFVPTPIIGLRGNLGVFNELTLSFEFKGMSLHISDFKTTYLDVYGGVDVKITESLSTFFGYKYLASETIFEKEDNVEFRMESCFNGVIFRVGLIF